MVPLTASPVPGWSGVDTLILWSDPRDFAVRLDLRLLDPDLTHLGFALRTEAASDPLVWSNVLANLRRVAGRCEVEWVGGSSFAGRATSHAGFEGIGTLGAMALEVSDLQRHLDVTGPPSVGVRDLEAELAAARAEVEELKEECAHLAWKLDVTKASRWWQLRERLLPLLVPLARVQRRSNPEWHEYRASNPPQD
jgi:hypothetical protein